MKFLHLLLSLALVQSSDLKSEHVEVLTIANFDAFIEETKEHGGLVMFHADWCGHCKALMPKFLEAGEHLKSEGDKVRLAICDAAAAENQDLGTKYKVEGYPTLKIFQKGAVHDYDGPRSKDGIVEHVRIMTGPAIVSMKVADVPEIKAGVPQVVIRGPTLTDEIVALAGAHRTKAKFVFLEEATVSATIQHLGEPSIEATLENLADKLSAHAMPFFGQIDRDTYGKYAESEKGMVWIFFDNAADNLAETVEIHREGIIKVAKEVPTFYFGYIDTKAFAREVEGMFSLTTFPAVVVQPSITGKVKFTYEEPLFADDKINAAPLEAWLKKIVSGEIQPVLQSKPDPSPRIDEHGVTEVVGSTMKEILIDSGKSVLLGVFAAWCGHCKKMKPEYEKLATRVKEAGFDDQLIIAQLDGNENDSHLPEVEWKAFPTLLFFNKGKKVEYDGGRDPEEIWAYLMKELPELAARSGDKIAGGDTKEEL